MSAIDLRRLESRITTLFTEVERSEGITERLEAEMAKLLCVLTAGYLEIACRETLVGYVAVRAQPPVVAFVERRLRRVTNVKPQKLYDLVAEFDTSLRDRLKARLDGRLAGSILSVVTNRHEIAHGRDYTASMGVTRQWFDDVRAAMEELNALLPPGHDGSRRRRRRR